jgi:outer membrane receptor protein involved in Fe transport
VGTNAWVQAAIPAFLAITLGFALDANAQESEADPQVHEEIDEIIVTGSRIKRRDFLTLSPLTTIDRNEIEFSGQATIEETLTRIPQVFPSFGRTSNQELGGGVAWVDLRGLGPGRTLTLLNGRRLALSGAEDGFDLNNLPEFLIERVEIITGGTSAVYGSDAIAGVVNFITRDDFQGFGVEAGMTMAAAGDAETYDINLVYGQDFAGGRGNITAFGNYYERTKVYSGDREATATTYFDDWEGNLIEFGSPITPDGAILWPEADLGDGPVSIRFDPDGTPRERDWLTDSYNYLPENYLQVPLERRAIGAFGHYDFSNRYQGYFEASFTRSEAVNRLAAVPLQLYVETNLDNPVLTPEARQVFTDNYACAQNLACMVLGRRTLEVGPRFAESTADYRRVVAGIRGELTGNWEIDAWVTHERLSRHELILNLVSQSRIRQGLLVDPATNDCYEPSGGCVPLDFFGAGRLSIDGAGFIRGAPTARDIDRTDKLMNLVVTGSPYELPAGPLDLAFGAEWRSQEVHRLPDPDVDTADLWGWWPYTPTRGREEVLEVYTEAIVPLARDRSWADFLGIEIGARYSEYEFAGGAWTYKAGAAWWPVESVHLRVMHQRSVRAPNAVELFEEQSVLNWRLNTIDPCSAENDPVGNDMVEKCIIQGLAPDQIGVFEAWWNYPVDFIYGGNPELEPEEAETWTAGIVISPAALPRLSMSIDYFEMEVTNTIGGIETMEVCFDAGNTAHAFCDDITRDETGNVARVSQITQNRGLMRTTGVDTQVQYRFELPRALAIGDRSADLEADIYWTHLLSHEEQENIVSEVVDCAGYYGFPCGRTFPSDRVTTNLHYASGSLDAHLTWSWIDKIDNAASLAAANWGLPDPDLAIPGVDDEHYFDVGFAYTFNDVFVARFGVNNLLDTEPPQTADAIYAYSSDLRLFDPFGRSYYLTLSAKFE